jgi:hypothetical protein
MWEDPRLIGQRLINWTREIDETRFQYLGPADSTEGTSYLRLFLSTLCLNTLYKGILWKPDLQFVNGDQGYLPVIGTSMSSAIYYIPANGNALIHLLRLLQLHLFM